MSRRSVIFLLTVLAASFTVLPPRIARAQEVYVKLDVKAPDQTDPKQKGKAPSIKATIVGGAKTTVDKFTLSTTNAGQKVTMKAEKLQEYTEGTETLAIALVLCGQEIWIGNKSYEPDPNAQYDGVLATLEAAIDKLQLGGAGPPGSKGVVISYSQGAEIKVPMGDLKVITGGALGSEKDYHGKISNDMVQGVTLAIAELSKVATARKVLIVVGDGNDTNNENAKLALGQLKKDLGKANIEAFAIIYKSQMSSEGAVITTMIPTAKTVNTIDGIPAELTAIVSRMADRYYLTFPGYDPTTKLGLPWDGKDHDLVLRNDQTDYDAVQMALAPKWDPPKEGGIPWLIVVLVIVGVLLLLIIGIKIFRKPAEEPMQMQMPMPVMPMGAAPQVAPEPPKPAGPMKTVMIGAGGDQDGFPIVGWIVALNGQDAYRTQRLKAGLTKIGTAPPADIVVNDGFMSTEHCQIQASPQGFILVDAGSTNGCYVNDRKVAKHDLLDNDVITLGKTNFKFKSIN